MGHLFFNDAKGFYEQGKLAMEEQRFADAVQAFRSSASLELTVEALLGLGVSALITGEIDEGMQALERAYELAPQDTRTMMTLTTSYLTLGDAEMAIAIAQEYIKISPEPLDGYLVLVEAYLSVGEFDDAKRTITRALKLAPDNSFVHLLASRVWMEQEEFKKALREAEHAVRLAPDNPQAHYIRGTALAALERYAEALPDIQRMLDADPTFSSALVSKGITLYYLGRQDEGLALLTQAQQEYANDPELLHGIAIFLFEIHRLAEAKAVVEQEIALFPDAHEAHALRYDIATALGDAAAMQEAYQMMLQTDDGSLIETLQQKLAEMTEEPAKPARRTGKKKHGSVQGVYQLKISLKGLRPPIWRRVLVPDIITLAEMHAVIQVAMGWEDCHLHKFVVNGTHYSIPSKEDAIFGIRYEDERRVELGEIARMGVKRFTYSYDFGDSWEHDILIEKELLPDPAATYPVCVKCVRACPPEDVGGTWGYIEFLEAIADPEHDAHDEMTEWIGGTFDPEACDLEAINARLARIKL